MIPINKIIEILLNVATVLIFCLGAGTAFKKREWKNRYLLFPMLAVAAVNLKTVLDWEQKAAGVSTVSLLLCVFFFLCYYIIAYEGRVLLKVICILYIFFIGTITEALLMIVELSFFHIDIQKIQERGLLGLGNVTVSTVFMALAFLILKRLRSKKIGISKELQHISGIMLGVNGGILTVLIFFFNGIESLSKDTLFVMMLGILMLVVVLDLLIFRSMMKVVQKNQKTLLELQYMKSQEEQNKRMEAVMQSLRQLRHDMNNHVGVMHGLCDTGQYELLNQYLQDMLKDMKQANDVVVVQENPALSIVVNNKRLLAEEKGIRFSFGIKRQGMEKEKKVLPFTDLELCSLFGNLLDNAIEACEKIENREKRRISLILGETEEGWQISCENSYAQAPVFEGEKLVTSKEDDRCHGIGTQAMKSIIKKHKGTLHYQVTEEAFLVLISIMQEQSGRMQAFA